MKKTELKKLLDTLPEAEIERLIAEGVSTTMAAAEKAGVTYKSHKRSVARFKAAPAKLAALAEVLEIDQLALMTMSTDAILDRIEDLLDDLIKADDDKPADSDEAGMLPSAGGAVATKGSGSWVDEWINRPSPARVARKAASRQPETARDLWLWSQGLL